MTTTEPVTPTPSTPSTVAIWRGVLAAEWTKLRSVRSTWWALLVAAVTAIAGSTILAATAAGHPKQPFDPVASIFVAWAEYPLLAVGIVGILSFSAEYATGLGSTTFAAVPQRLRVFTAKAATYGLLTLGFGEALAVGCCLLTQAITSRSPRPGRSTRSSWQARPSPSSA